MKTSPPPRPSASRQATKRQLEVLAWVRRYIDRHGYSPTMKEIAAGFGWSGPHPARCHLDLLEAKGYLTRQPGKARTIRVIENQVVDPLRSCGPMPDH